MTGFGVAESVTPEFKCIVEIKSLNSKFLDLSLKLPRALSHKEIEIRNIISRDMKRGKVALSVSIELLAPENNTQKINKDLFQAYYEKLKQLELQSEDNFQDIMKLALQSPDVLTNADNIISEENEQVVIHTIEKAVHQCSEFRNQEGNSLFQVLRNYANSISQSLDQIKKIEPKRLVSIKDRIKTNISELFPNKELDEDRLEQELIFYSEKLDISEEIERLTNHLDYFIKTINNESDGHGKKLGFITQEMGREINTMGSKANNSDIQKLVILMKEELEKIKEQILNIL